MEDSFSDVTETADGAIARGDPYLLPPGASITPRYRVVRLLGSGGSSHVYEVDDLQLSRRVALKLLRRDRVSSTAAGRLRREVAIASRISHPLIVRVHDLGESPEGLFITMELIEGESLRSRLGRGPLPPREAVAIARQIAEALAALHVEGVIHRDLKPSNILVTAEGGVRLVDFGLARHWESDLSRMTRADALVGTIEYLSPEQALGRAMDPRSDLYSFGIVMYEMLTGAIPFEGGSDLATVLAHLKERAPDVRKTRPEVPRWLARVVARLLEKRPEDRYPDAASVLDDLGKGRARFAVSRRALLAAAAAVVVIGSGIALALGRAQDFGSLVVSQAGVEALDRRGQTLWRREGMTFAQAVRTRGEVTDVVMAANPSEGGKENRTLVVVDPLDGTERRRIEITEVVFPGFSPDFTLGQLSAVDLEGNGTDVVVASFAHRYWPMWAALADPRTGRQRVVFTASGGHLLVGQRDVSGDGVADLIFAGINNRMGWYASVAAVDVSGFLHARQGWRTAASTPDEQRSGTDQKNLIWYALLPQGWPLDERSRVHEGGIEIAMGDGRSFTLTLDGFRADLPSDLPLAERQELRRRGWDAAAAIRTQLDHGQWDEALRLAAGALENARRANLPELVEWIERLTGIALIRAGRAEEGEARLRPLFDRSASPGDIAWDAARSLHLVGERDRALPWYQRGMARSEPWGRLREEFLMNLVVLRVERGELALALQDIGTAGAAVPSNRGSASFYEGFVRWQGGRPLFPLPLPDPSAPDFHRVLWLETRHAMGEDAGRLLTDAAREVEKTSELQPIVQSLQADLLARAGRLDEARPLARLAWDEAARRAAEDPVIRYFLPLVRERLDRVGG